VCKETSRVAAEKSPIDGQGSTRQRSLPPDPDSSDRAPAAGSGPWFLCSPFVREAYR
jgi:hypothetical protein